MVSPPTPVAGDDRAAGGVRTELAGVVDGVRGRAEPEVGHAVLTADLLGPEVLDGVVVADLAGDADGQVGRGRRS